MRGNNEKTLPEWLKFSCFKGSGTGLLARVGTSTVNFSFELLLSIGQRYECAYYYHLRLRAWCMVVLSYANVEKGD